MLTPDDMPQTAEVMAGALKFARIVAMLDAPGTQEKAERTKFVPVMEHVFLEKCHADGLSQEKIDSLLNWVDDEVALARDKIQSRN